MSTVSDGLPAASRSGHDLADSLVDGERFAEEHLAEERLADDYPACERPAEERLAEATSEAVVSSGAAPRGGEAGIETPGGQSEANVPSTDGAIRSFGRASFMSWFGIVAGVVLGAGCSASLGIAILGCLWVSRWLASVVLNAARSPRKYRMRLTVEAYMELDFLRNSSFQEGVRYAAASLVFLGTVIFLLVALRLLPDLMWLAHGGAIQDQIAQHFPAGIEVLLRNGTLSLQPPQEELRVMLPHVLFHVCGGNLAGEIQGPHMSGVADMLGVVDLRLLDLMLGGWLDLFLVPDVPDPYVRIAEFSVGERVEARLTSELVKCGAQRPMLPVPALGVWLPAIVEEVHHSTALRDMAYTLRLENDADTLGVEAVDQGGYEDPELRDGVGSAGSIASLPERCVVGPSSLRRLRPNALFVPARSSEGEDKSRMFARLQDDAALLVFEEKRFAVLEGFSFRHGQYWHYSNSQLERLRIWHNYTNSELHTYFPLACAMDVFCKREGGEDDLICSRERAQQNIEAILRGETYLPATRSGSLQVVLLLLALWVVCVTATLVVRTIALFLLYMPMVYLVCCLFRHVDTPLVPVGKICGLVLYSGMPPLYLFRLSHCILEVYGGDSRLLHPWLLHPLEWLTTYSSRVMALWSLWNGFLVIRMRELDAVRERRGRLAEARLQREAAASGGGSASQKAAVTSAPGGAADPTGTAAARGGDDEGGLPTCRICYGGWEEGRLISPCLCSGTMRFVHLECLNMWRLGSANPQSCYQCEQCHYRYSLRRTRLATILRSALVLHAVTLAAFVCAVLLCSFASVWMETHFFDSQRLTLTSDEFIVQLVNGTEVTVEEIRESLSALDSFNIFGLQMIHLVSGFAMVGISGLFIMGFSWFPLMRGHRGMGWPIAFLIGCVRVLMLMYGFFKTSSGRLLRSMEDVVLEVSAAAEQGDCQGAVEGTEDAGDTAGGADGYPLAPTASAAGQSGQPVELSTSATDIWPAKAVVPRAAAANDSQPPRSEDASEGTGFLEAPWTGAGQDAQREQAEEHWQLRRRSGPAEASEES